MKQKVFKSPDDWSEFCRFISKTNRYVLDKHWRQFTDTVISTAAKREHTLKSGSTLARARIGSREEEYEDSKGDFSIDFGPLGRQDMEAPPPHKAKDGRINPHGISYLYLSNDIETAILEVRPWLKQDVSVGFFKITKDLKCVDTSRDRKGTFIYIGRGKPKLAPDTIEEYVWGGINDSFSRPVAAGDERTDYIPTQYLSECFKVAGYDGIIYKSSLTGKGYNIALFNPENARLQGAKVYSIESIKLTYKECAQPYFCKSTEK